MGTRTCGSPGSKALAGRRINTGDDGRIVPSVLAGRACSRGGDWGGSAPSVGCAVLGTAGMSRAPIGCGTCGMPGWNARPSVERRRVNGSLIRGRIAGRGARVSGSLGRGLAGAGHLANAAYTGVGTRERGWPGAGAVASTLATSSDVSSASSYRLRLLIEDSFKESWEIDDSDTTSGCTAGTDSSLGSESISMLGACFWGADTSGDFAAPERVHGVP